MAPVVEQVRTKLANLRQERAELASKSEALGLAILELGWVLDLLIQAESSATETTKRQPKGAVGEAVMKALDGGFTLSIEEIVAASNQKASSVRAALKTLVAARRAFITSDGRYTTMKQVVADAKGGGARGTDALVHAS